MNGAQREINRAAQLIDAGEVKPKPGEDGATLARRAVGAVRTADARARRARRKAKREARKATR